MTQWTLDMSGLTDYAFSRERLSIYRLYNKIKYKVDLETVLIK